MKFLLNPVFIVLCYLLAEGETGPHWFSRGNIDVIPKKGVVKARKDGQIDWQIIGGSAKLAKNDYLFLGSGSIATIKAEIQVEQAQNQKREISIELHGPGVLGVTDNLIRRMRLDVSQAGGSGGGSASGPPPEGSNELLGFDDANNLAATFESKELLRDLSETGQALVTDQESTEVDPEASKVDAGISITNPSQGAVLSTDKLPHEVRLVWQKPKNLKNESMRVMAKHDEEGQYKKLAETKSSLYTVQLPRPGGYELLIQSSDGKWRSKKTKVFVDRPKEVEVVKENSHFEILSPKPNTQYIVKGLQARVLFSFEGGGGNKVHYTLSIRDDSRTEVYKQSIHLGEETQLLVALEPGRYNWVIWKGSTPPDGLKVFRLDVQNGPIQLKDLIGMTQKEETGLFGDEKHIIFN